MLGRFRGSRSLVLLLVLCWGPGCAGARLKAVDPMTGLACDLDDQAMVRDTVYFGRNRPTGGTVSDDEWQAFVSDVVTPRFPDGFTVVAATGQWKGKSGQVELETTEVLVVLHPDDDATNQAVIDIANEYKRRFAQEAVLRERTPTCARFQ